MTDFATIAHWIVSLAEAFLLTYAALLAFHAIRITIQRRSHPHPRLPHGRRRAGVTEAVDSTNTEILTKEHR